MSLLGERWKALTGGWAGIAALGTFGLQAAGFLSLRFHLAALGVPADLGLLDARYLFEGANCLIFVLTALASWLLLLLMVYAVGWLVSRLIPKRFRVRITRRISTWWNERVSPLLVPSCIAWLGVVLAVLLIQLALRQCLQFQNLLIASGPPRPRWLATILLSESDVPLSLFLGGAVLLIGVTVALWATSEREGNKPLGGRLLGLLLILEIGLVPINYGVLTANHSMERVSGIESLSTEAESWLVWEDDHRLVVLVIPTQPGRAATRKLVLASKGSLGPIHITGRERLLQRLLRENP